jgi:hypothetical protein
MSYDCYVKFINSFTPMKTQENKIRTSVPSLRLRNRRR